jgi:hypothetical protein
MEKYTFRSQPITLTGQPPSSGWVFGYTSPCCRNNDIQNLSNTGASFFFKAIMHGDGRPSQHPCYDSSPQFMANVEPALCEGYDFQFNSNVVDNEFDSLSFQWANVVNSSSSTTTYQPVIAPWAVGFSRTNPTPTSAQNPLNKPATLNAKTGDVNFFAILPPAVPANKFGIYVASIQVDSWRRNATTGQRAKVATVFRDLSFSISRCPNIDFYYLDALNDTITINQKNLPPSLEVNGRKNSRSIDTTLALGDTLVLDYRVVDNGISPCGTNRVTDVYMVPMGVQFDSLFSNTNGNCLLPPCATLSPAPVGQLNRFSGASSLNTQFKWTVDCAHLAPVGGNAVSENTRLFQFVFKLYDDFCPIPLVNYSSLNISVELFKPIEVPKVYCFKATPNGIDFSYELLQYNSSTFSKVEIYLGRRPIGSPTPFVFYPTPFEIIRNYTGSHTMPSSNLPFGAEYVIQLVQVDSTCGQINRSARTAIFSNGQSDSVDFKFAYDRNSLKVLNHFIGTIQWYRNGVAIPNATSKSIAISTTGNYSLSITMGSCIYRSQPYGISTVGINEMDQENIDLSIFPNPTTNRIYIGGLSQEEEVRSIRVYNLVGELVLSVFDEKSIDLSALQNQLYLIRVETSAQVITKKVIKQ